MPENPRTMADAPARHVLCWLALLLVLSWWGPARAQTPLVLTGEHGKVDVSTAWERAMHPAAVTDADAALARVPAAAWQVLDGPLGDGFGRTPVTWLRVVLRRDAFAPVDWWLRIAPPHLDHIDIVLRAPSGATRTWLRGDRTPHATTPVTHRHTVLPLHLDESGDWTLVLGIRTTGALLAQATLSTPERFRRDSVLEHLALGVAYGLLATMALAALILRALTGDRRLSAYATSVAATGLGFMTLDGVARLAPLSPGMRDLLTPLAVCLANAAMIWMFVQLYGTRTRHPRIHRVFLGLLWLNGASAALLLVRGHDPLIVARHLGIVLQVSLGAWLGWRQRHDEGLVSRLIFVASLTALLGVGPMVLRAFGVLPTSLVTVHAYKATLLLQPLVLMGALGMRAWRVQRQAQRRARQDLADTREANALLEHRVAERTAALQAEIDQRRQLELALAERLEETSGALDLSRRALAQQRQFTAVVSHEFFTPLAAIDLSAQALREMSAEELATGLADGTDRIRGQVKVLGELVEDCVALARLDHAAPARETLSWRALIEAAHRDAGCAATHPLRITLHDDGFHGEGRLLRLALTNLLRNAARHAPVGTPVEVSVHAERDAGRPVHRLRVRDAGPGFDPALREHLFEPFRRGGATERPGLGLGLYIVARVAERHGGRAQAPADARGGCVELVLPLE